MLSPSLFPFSSVSNIQLADNFSHATYSISNVDVNLKKIRTDTLTDDITDTLEFKYYTPCQLNDLANRYRKNTKLSIFHVNVRSLNANCNKLITFLQSLSFNFYIIILSEVWSTNLSYYTNLLLNYDFFYDLPNNRAGGVGIFVRRSLNAVQISKYNAPLSKIKPRHYENVWIEICVDK